ALDGAFEQKYKLDGDMAQLNDSGNPLTPHMPAIAIFPTSAAFGWYTHRQQKNVLILEVRIWTGRWEYSQAMRLMMQTRAAIWRGSDGSGVSYVKAATGFHPEKTSDVTFKPVSEGDSGAVKALRAEMTVNLQ